MLPQDAKDLLKRYLKGDVTESEKTLVESWYLRYKPNTEKVDFEQLKEDQIQSLDELMTQISPAPVRKLWPGIAVAASILFIIGAFYLYRPVTPVSQQVVYKKAKHELLPGGNKATLTLANGQQIVLSGTLNGQIASQGNVAVKKTSTGQIVYSPLKGGTPAQADLYNIATTPRGGQYAFTLADGTKVWLNAASSIKFPVAFNGKERKVELTGEAYFEVAHNAAKPFSVIVKGQVVKDLGTQFNINAYTDEATIKTTLLQGSVNVSSGGESYVLKPGQQSILKGENISITDADPDEVMAWKNGLFYFKDADIKTVMRQMARWYDADISYEGNLPDRKFSGKISRNLDASQLLDILSFKKIHFRIDGKNIVITH